MKRPVQIFSDAPNLNCDYCGKNLLEEDDHGNFIVFYAADSNQKELKCIKFACKEHDHLVTAKARAQNLIDAGWDDVEDLLIPTIWIKKLMAFVNELFTDRNRISEEYFNDVKHMFLNTFPYVARKMDKHELERVSILLQFDL